MQAFCTLNANFLAKKNEFLDPLIIYVNQVEEANQESKRKIALEYTNITKI